ncbi:MAG TPA: hypothetical protein PLX56_08410 [bacterium]|nr:hypothetical protein [bacterium]HQN72084.1 hypothetical protein [bacterium]HQO92335.1 hypothetical protein [bacterium]
MKKMVFLLITFLVQLVFPGELVLDLKKENVNKLEKKATVLYGEKDSEVGVFIAQKPDETSYGVSSFLVDKDVIYVIDSVNGKLKSAEISDFKFSSKINIKPNTIDILKDKESIYLYNFQNSEFLKVGTQNLVPVIRKKTTSPIFKPFSNLTNEIGKKVDDVVSVSKNSVKTATISVLKEKHTLVLKNSDLGSLQFISSDGAGNLHFVVEIIKSMNPIKVERYWLKTDNSFKLLNISNLPISDIFLPFREIQVNSDGTIWFINPAVNGLEILFGKGR